MPALPAPWTLGAPRELLVEHAQRVLVDQLFLARGFLGEVEVAQPELLHLLDQLRQLGARPVGRRARRVVELLLRVLELLTPLLIAYRLSAPDPCRLSLLRQKLPAWSLTLPAAAHHELDSRLPEPNSRTERLRTERPRAELSAEMTAQSVSLRARRRKAED